MRRGRLNIMTSIEIEDKKQYSLSAYYHISGKGLDLEVGCAIVHLSPPRSLEKTACKLEMIAIGGRSLTLAVFKLLERKNAVSTIILLYPAYCRKVSK